MPRTSCNLASGGTFLLLEIVVRNRLGEFVIGSLGKLYLHEEHFFALWLDPLQVMKEIDPIMKTAHPISSTGSIVSYKE